MSELKRTPLYDFNAKYSPRFVPFAGWEMPVSFSGIIDEHKAVREVAGLFDVSHMGEARVTGPDAKRFLNTLVTNDMGRIQPGQAIYSLMCQEDGGVVDDIILYQISDEEYFICLNASNAEKDVKWMKSHANGFECKVEDISVNYAQIAIQGPQAESILMEIIPEISGMRRFHFEQVTYLGSQILISRTGYTGEDGFEIYIPSESALMITSAIYENGESKGLTLCGLGSRDSLRLEAGFPLYGHEISEVISPISAGLNWAVRFKKAEDFVGRKALITEKDEGPKSRVVFYKLEDRRIAREGAIILADGEEVGKVLSGTFSPVLNAPIGSALISSCALKAKKPLVVDLRGKLIPLTLVTPPMHKE
jgi:aminomethyltransferase